MAEILWTSFRVQGLPGHPELGRHQHGGMALLDSGQLHHEPIPANFMWWTAVVATGERGEHDKGTKPADTHPHHHGGAERFTSGTGTGGYPPSFGVRPDTEVVKHLVGSQRGSQNMQSARHAAKRPWTARASHTPRRPGDKPQRTSDQGLQIRRLDRSKAAWMHAAGAGRLSLCVAR